MKTLTFVDAAANPKDKVAANANADSNGSTISLCELCSGELKQLSPLFGLKT